jgi:hypothetical protein
MYYFNQPYCQEEIKKIFIDKPLSLLAGNKLNFIISTIRNENLKNILEIGTFAGGTTYLLSKEFSNSQITTIDLNNFKEYFYQYDHQKIIKSIKEGYFEIDINEDNFYKIQEIYKELSPNATFLTGNLKSLDMSTYDAIIIDGDHTIRGLLSDLEYCFSNMKSGIIFVDDCVHAHIKECCINFCQQKNIDCDFNVYCDYGNISGNDICVIKKH